LSPSETRPLTSWSFSGLGDLGNLGDPGNLGLTK